MRKKIAEIAEICKGFVGKLATTMRVVLSALITFVMVAIGFKINIVASRLLGMGDVLEAMQAWIGTHPYIYGCMGLMTVGIIWFIIYNLLDQI